MPDLLATIVRFPAQAGISAGGCAGPDPGVFRSSNRKPDVLARQSRERPFSFFPSRRFKTFHRRRSRPQISLEPRGGVLMENLDENAIADAEAQIARATKWQADQVYDREWATSLLREALHRLTQESALAGKAELVAYLTPYLAAPEESAIPYEEMAQQLHRPIATLRSDVARLRARYRAILREEVRGTVGEAEEVDEELRHLCRALAAA